MKIRTLSIGLLVCCAVVATSCKQPSSSSGTPARSEGPAPDQPAALPDNGFKAAITLVDPPAKLRVGQKETILVKVKNASDVMWYARGAAVNNSPGNKFYLAAGNRWLQGDDESLVTDMDGRYGLNRDLKPGEETEVPLAITAPKEPGDYILEVDVVQEQVAWFLDKGSQTARTKVTVVK